MTDTTNVSRRQLLARLGLAAGAVYVAPTMVHLNAAHASTGGSGASGGGSGPSGASAASGPSGVSGVSVVSGASRPGRRALGGGGQGPLWILRNGN